MKGEVAECLGAGFELAEGTQIEVPLIAHDGSPNNVRWTAFKDLDVSEAGLHQTYVLRITAAVVNVTLRRGDDENQWHVTLSCDDDAGDGSSIRAGSWAKMSSWGAR